MAKELNTSAKSKKIRSKAPDFFAQNDKPGSVLRIVRSDYHLSAPIITYWV